MYCFKISQCSSSPSFPHQDHWALEEVRGMVSDTAWAVKDLKTSQDQLHIDFLAFKRFQQLQNDTMIELEGEFLFPLSRDIVPCIILTWPPAFFFGCFYDPPFSGPLQKRQTPLPPPPPFFSQRVYLRSWATVNLVL